MAESNYLQGKLREYLVDTQAAQSAGNTIFPVIERWASGHLVKATFSGSLAKGTAVSCGTDADIFISLSSECSASLSHIYDTLYKAVTGAGYEARKQNVSIGTTVNGYKIDLVPGKRQSQWGNDHSLYKSKTGSWTKTNIDEHINTVKGCGRIDEIRLTKIWRACHGLEFPSFYLELAVIEACKHRTIGRYTDNLIRVLEYFRDSIEGARFVDPANTGNVISSDLTSGQKRQIAQKARASLSERYWEDILW